MFTGLDSPTVFRVGEPTIGPPRMALDYRTGALPEPLRSILEEVVVLPSPQEGVVLTRFEYDLLLTTVHDLLHRVEDLEVPWWVLGARWVRRVWARLWT